MPHTEPARITPSADPAPEPRSRPGFDHVLACIDVLPGAGPVLKQAIAMAELMGARLSILRVMEGGQGGGTPVDPLEFDLRRRDVKAELDRIAGDLAAPEEARVEVLNGAPADCICRWAAENGVDLTVMGTGGHGDWVPWGLGGTVRRVVENVTGSVLLVPAAGNRDATPGGARSRFRQVMVALDGSAPAEATIPVAGRIAAGHEAELLLVHAQPDLPLTVNGPPTPEDEDLRARLRRRNERIAKDYLRRMRALIPVEAKRTRTLLLNENDPRHAISAAVSGEGADLLVLGKCGQGGHRDLPIGSTAEFLVSCTTVPVLLVNCRATARPRRHARAPRRPSSGPVLS